MKFVIRDDDTCAFTTAEDLLACYRPIWGEMPVSLSVTPFRIPGKYHFVPPSLHDVKEPLALDKSDELVSFLKEALRNKQIDVSIHGYHHNVYDGIPEYVAGPDLVTKTAIAKNYLSNLLEHGIQTFVPPHNSIGKEGFSAVVQAGLNLVNIPSLWSWKVRKLRFDQISKMPRFYWHRKICGYSYPHVLTWDDHKEVAYHTAGPGSDKSRMVEEFDYCYDNDGVFILATHYHAFNLAVSSGGTVRDLVYALINRAKGRSGVSFVRINDIWQ